MKEVRVLLSLIIFCFTMAFAHITMGQEAEEWFTHLQENFQSLDPASYSFTLTIELPEQEPMIQEGSLVRDNERYSFTLGDRWVKSNGITQWIYDPDLDEVQIYDASDNENSPFSPTSFLPLEQINEFDCQIEGESQFEGKTTTTISCKPKDVNNDITKMRIAIDSKSKTPLYFWARQRDGSQYALKIGDINTSPNVKDSRFTFKQEDYPNTRVEDLRM